MKSFLTPDWPAPANIKAYTTTRHGWGDPESRVLKSESIEKLVKTLQLPDTPIWLKQYHSIVVVKASPDQRGAEADASFSIDSPQICMVETADCLPILICNSAGTTVAAIHAGWRGLAAGIIESTLVAMAQPADELLVWLGPAIGPNKFEVGRDVYDAFVSRNADTKSAFVPHKEKWLANLYELARQRLNAHGIAAIYGGEYCTHSQPDLFYSYRRDGGSTGRMASVIWLETTG